VLRGYLKFVLKGNLKVDPGCGGPDREVSDDCNPGCADGGGPTGVEKPDCEVLCCEL